jgi:DNA-binding GntR family transcriptional regulator
MILPPGRMKMTIAEHRAVYEHILAGDAEGARAAMAAHLGAVADLFEALARAKPAQFAN